MKRQDYLTACAVIELLAERFPKTFFVHEQRRRPLKVGIHLDLKATLDGALGEREMKLALTIYCRNKCYRAKLRKGAWRIDLAGNVVDTIMQDFVPRRRTDGESDKELNGRPAPA